MGFLASARTVFFLKPAEAHAALERFECTAIAKLLKPRVLHADEWGTKLNSEVHWPHFVSNPKWTLVHAHPYGEMQAIEFMEVLNHYRGILVHDHGKTLSKLECQHTLCNAHQLRALTLAHEEDHQAWAARMRRLLL
jgi:transposase